MNDERIETLETRIAFQDETIETLHAELLALRAELKQLQETVRRLKDRAASAEAPGVGDAADEPPPPHY